MAWRMTGQMIEACSCKMMCPCYFGPAEPDQGWCSGAIVFNVQQGNSDGVNLGGCKVVMVGDWPGDFFSGNGTARLCIDAADADQRRELEAIFSGKKGGPPAAVGALITKWLPAQATKIEVQLGDNPSVTVGSVGQLKFQWVKTEDGRQTKLQNVPSMAAFGVESADLARSDGSQWSDPEMRRWQSGGSGSVSTFNLSA